MATFHEMRWIPVRGLMGVCLQVTVELLAKVDATHDSLGMLLVFDY